MGRALTIALFGALFAISCARAEDACGPTSDDPSLVPGSTVLAPVDPRSELIVPPSEPDPTPPPDKPYWRSNIFKRVLTDQAFLVTKWWPSEIQRPGFSAPLMVAVVAAARSTDDENALDFRTERAFDERTGRGSNGVARGFTMAGDGLPASLALGATYLLARRGGNDRLAEASSLSFEALVSTGLWVEVLKRTTARHRPSQGSHGDFFEYGQSDTSSFPSGHAAGAFTVATVFAHVYADKKWVPWVAYGTAGLIGASRIALGRHFPSDVVAGAVLGNSFGRMALARNESAGPARPLALSNFHPILDPSRREIGVGYSYSWGGPSQDDLARTQTPTSLH